MTATLTPPGATPDTEPIRSSRPEASTSPPTRAVPRPKGQASAGNQHGSSHVTDDAHLKGAAAAQHDDGQSEIDPHTGPAVVAERPPAPANLITVPGGWAPGLVDPLLILAAQALDDLEATRIANENRLRSLRDVYGLAGSTQEAEAAGLVDGLKALEHQAELSLRRALRRHPLGGWVKATVGVGEKQGARLLAAIGDPYWNTLHDRPRTVSELRSYCGVGDAREQVRRRGQRANWSVEAKSRVWLVSCSCIKQADSPYRPVYDAGRARYVESAHQEECHRCGPSGRPAAAGSPLSAGHQHARALRLVSKALLRDLWLEARDLHGEAA